LNDLIGCEYCYRIVNNDDSNTSWIAWYEGENQLRYLQELKQKGWIKNLEWKVTFIAKQCGEQDMLLGVVPMRQTFPKLKEERLVNLVLGGQHD
jgi:hypothetical protein